MIEATKVKEKHFDNLYLLQLLYHCSILLESAHQFTAINYFIQFVS